MKHIVLPDNQQRRLIFYLAMEEFVANELDEPEAFFMWQVPPTVIFGRNQLMEAEVNVDYCRRNGISLFRRKSGGGCVYSDMGNVMLSCITSGDNVAFLFDRYLQRIAFLLRKKGIDAHVSGRNDIMVDGKKVSGNAFLKLPGKCIIHGTMLYDTDFGQMELALTPSQAKLESKGVSSVRKHVANLREFSDIDIDDLKSYIISEMCRDGERCLTDSEVERIKEIEQTYLDESFFSGKNPAYAVTKKAKLENVGELEARIEMRHGTVRHIGISGDFFALSDAEPELNARLKGIELGAEPLRNALADFDAGKFILNLSTDQLIELLIKP